MKKLYVVAFVLSINWLAFAHCGTCGIPKASVSKEKKPCELCELKHKSKISDLNLTPKQEIEFDKILKEYNIEMKKLEADKDKKLSAILTDKQLKLIKLLKHKHNHNH